MTGPVTTPGPFAFDPANVSPSGEATVDITDFVREKQVLAHAAGRREALAEMAAWHEARETFLLADGDSASREDLPRSAGRAYLMADTHGGAARHAKALAAAADDPAGPLPLRVRYRVDCSDPGYVSLRVFIGPEHGAVLTLHGIVRAEEFPALRAGWPGAAFIEETPRGTGG